MNREKEVLHQKRSSNFELLRIIAMFMIVLGHMSGQAFDKDLISTSGRIFEIVFCSGSRIAVNLFLMVGIWFMVDTKFRASRVLKLYGALWFYSAFITILLLVLGFDVSLKDKISCFFPYLRCWMWFVPVYISLILVSPFLKKAFLCMGQGTVKTLIIIGFFIISGVSSVSVFMDTRFCALLWFIYVYFVIGYYKKYIALEIRHKSYFLICGMLIYSLLVIGKLVCHYNNGTIFIVGEKIVSQYLGDYKSIPNFACSLCIFIYFSKLNIGTNRVINELSKNTLDVYMIHQQVAFYTILWDVICQCHTWQESNCFIAYYIVTAVGVYVVCSLVGRCRVYIIEPLWEKSGLFKKLCYLLDKLYISVNDD